jgi:hypothetical protein
MIDSEFSKYYKLILDLGKGGVNSLFPRDFELYICSLELTKITEEKEKTTDFFVFPIMPNQISERLDTMINIKKSNAAITTLINTTFVPTTITINGNFGRDFKFIIGKSEIFNNPLHYKGKRLPIAIKTGFGCIKILEDFINKSKMLDKSNNPYCLYFYNPALGNSYLVEPISFEQKQDLSSNMIWNYTLVMKSIAPISELKKIKGSHKGSMTKMMLYSSLQKGLISSKNSLLSNLTSNSITLDGLVTKVVKKLA